MGKEIKDSPVYMDYAAATPVDPHVVDAMVQWMVDHPGSHYAPHHAFGRSVADRIEEARAQVARCIGANPSSIIFTSSATEANNLAILGLADHLRKNGKTHIITHAIEHRSVLGPIDYLQAQGFKVTIVPARTDGVLALAGLEKVLSPDTGLISLQAVNNELGTIQPLAQAAEILKGKGIFLHTDAAQALSRTAFSVADIPVDLATISAQKAYGPRGIAALYVRENVRQHLVPLMMDGGAGDLRPGSLPVALCAGFGAACDLAAYSEAENTRLENLRQAFLDQLKIKIADIIVHGASAPGNRVPGIISLHIPGISSETLVSRISDIAFGVAASSAAQGRERLSHIISAVTGDEEAVRETIRVSFGRFTRAKDLDRLARSVTHIYQNRKEAV